VFRAYDPDQDRLVAVKVFALDLQPDQGRALVARLRELVELDLTHPAVAAPVAAGVSNGSAYLAQDFAAADSLDVVMREFGAASPADAARVAAHVGGALHSAAALGVYHGSLHPRDLLLTADDTRVTGFGVAQALGAIGVPSPVRPPYSAPERMTGSAWDSRADVYSLAVLLAEILTGRAPSDPSTLEALLAAAPTDLRAFGAVLRRAMAERPEERYETALAFTEAFRSAADLPRTLRSDPALVELSSAARSLRSGPATDEPRLPLDEPVRGAAEAILPGDAPAAAPDTDSWDTPLMAFGASEDGPEVSRLSVATHGASDRTVLDWERPTNRLTVADGDLDVDLRPSLESGDISDAGGTSPGGTHGLGALDRWGRVASRPLNGAFASEAAEAGATDARAEAAPRPSAPPPIVMAPASSSVWPIPLALMVGIIMGIAVGFFIFGSREGSDETAATSSVAETATAAGHGPAAEVPPPAASTPNPGTDSRVAGATTTSGSTPGATSGRETADLSSGGPSSATDVAAARSRTETTDARDTPERTERPALRAASSGATAASSAPRRPTATGRLLVRSSPAGARVLLDGKDVGATPITLRTLALGSHTVRLTRGGYTPEERRITMSVSQPAQSVIVDLTPTRDRGASNARAESASPRPPTTGATVAALIIDSRPAGAAVYIDGRRVGITPATIDSVRIGQHTIFLELEGFRGWSALMQFAPGENRVSATLEP
jgi:serine/threonine-protein kinase